MGRSLLLIVFVIAAFFKVGTQKFTQAKQVNNRQAATTIFLVRHAEKVTTDPQDQDPDLSPAGLQRARDLRAYLHGQNLDAFFATPYKRTQKTLSYLTKGPIQFYDAHDFENLRARVLQDYKGKTVIIVGHSNTLLPIIQAFGARKPIDQIADDQYDDIFKLKISPRGKASVQAFKYGALSS